MSLSTEDLTQIRTLLREEIDASLDRKLEPIFGKLEALENDIKDIYEMISDLQRKSIFSKDYQEKSLEDKILTVHAEVVAMAKQAGISLPQN